MDTIRNQHGDAIAWISTGGCQNRRCRQAVKAGRPVHITPAHTDPRAAAVTLALPEYHFATADEAAAALELAWKTAETAETAAQRDDAYARHAPVKVSKAVGRQAEAGSDR